MGEKRSNRVKPPLKFHGGKRYLAERVLEIMPRHLHYVEPYFGGGQVLFRRDPADARFWWDGPTSDGRKPDGVSELINDLDGDLMNFYSVLKNPDTFGRLHEWLQKTPFSEDEWREAGEVLAGPPGDPVVRAGSLFVRVRQSMSGRRDTFCPTTRTRLRGGRNGDVYAWQNAIDGLPAVHERLRDLRVLNQPALDVIRREDQPETLFYLDPPYVHETRTSAEVYGQFEMTLGDHRGLLETIRGCRGKVILSGYDNGLYNTMLSDWTRHAFDLPNNAAGGATKQRMTEVLWCNF
jgi:DNA adenine methylase